MKKLTLCLLLIATLSGVLKAQNIMAEHHLESIGFKKIVVLGLFCDVNVSKGDRIVFDGIVEGSGDKDAFKIYSIESDTSVIFKVERVKIVGSDIYGRIRRSEFNILLPNDVSVDILTSSGDVKIEGLSAGQNRVETSSGDVFADRVHGNLGVVTSSGEVTIHDVYGDLDSQSSSGDHEYEDINGNLRAVSTSGDISINSVLGDIYAEASSGDIDIEVSEGKVSLNTTSGSIEGKKLLLTGDSDAQAASGDIKIEFVNNLLDVGFRLQSTSGDLRVGNDKAEKGLVINRGSILFQGKTTSGDQSYGN